MQEGTVGRRYAKALVLSLEKEGEARLSKIEGELAAVAALLDRRKGNPEFRQAMLNPSFSVEQKKAVLGAVAKAHDFDAATQVFLQLLLDKERLPQLPSIARAFRAEVDERVGRVRATVVSAKPLDQKALTEIVAGLEKRVGKKVIPDVEIDPSVVAGVKAKIGGLVFDATVESQLARLRSEFNVQ